MVVGLLFSSFSSSRTECQIPGFNGYHSRPVTVCTFLIGPVMRDTKFKRPMIICTCLVHRVGSMGGTRPWF